VDDDSRAAARLARLDRGIKEWTVVLVGALLILAASLTLLYYLLALLFGAQGDEGPD
jgi:hypothetical protein